MTDHVPPTEAELYHWACCLRNYNPNQDWHEAIPSLLAEAREAARLRTEIGRLYAEQPDYCADCGHAMTLVRPGKYQCDVCPIIAERDRYKRMCEAVHKFSPPYGVAADTFSSGVNAVQSAMRAAGEDRKDG